jgi:hypothetical protein
MKLYPFYECVEAIEPMLNRGANIFQQFNCAKCGTKQTMADKNIFYKRGKCEECGAVTDIEKDGCNYMLHQEL